MSYPVAKNAAMLLIIMMEHEKAISDLYATFAAKFPSHATFWQDLTKEEQKHAALIEHLSQCIKNGSETMLVIERFPVPAIQTSIEYVRKLISKSQEPDFKLINALSLSLQIEKALIESNCFDIFDGDSPRVRSILSDLASDTQRHRTLIENALQEYKDVIRNK